MYIRNCVVDWKNLNSEATMITGSQPLQNTKTSVDAGVQLCPNLPLEKQAILIYWTPGWMHSGSESQIMTFGVYAYQ